MWFDMTIDEDPSWISNIDLVFEGYGEIDGTFQIWAYDYSTSSWGQIGTDQEIVTGSDGTMIRSITSGFGNYISGSGILTWGVFFDESTVGLGSSGYWVSTDYVRAVVDYTAVPTSTPTPTLSATPTATVPVPTATPTPTITPCTDIYNYVGVNVSSGPHDAFYCDIDRMPPEGNDLNSKTEATDGEYLAISASDDSRWQTLDPGRRDYVFLWLDMIIDESPASIGNIDLVFEGYGEVTGNFSIWAYNNVASSWDQIGSVMLIGAGMDATMVRSITSNCGDYVGGTGLITWGVYFDETTRVPLVTNGRYIVIDYVELGIDYTCP